MSQYGVYVMISVFIEYYDEDEAYGHSFDDNYCISPGTGRYLTAKCQKKILVRV